MTTDSRRCRPCFAALIAIALVSLGLRSAVCQSTDAQPIEEQPYAPKIAPASDEAQKAMAGFRVPVGLKLSLFAAEPLLANPVAFSIDERGRFFVAETFRLHAGVTDTRRHMNWLDDDLACRTVADRVAMYRKYLGEAFATYGVDHDRVRLIEDRDGDGRADSSTVFADGFHSAADGIGSGILARGRDVWYACIPDLWLLRDSDTNNTDRKNADNKNGDGNTGDGKQPDGRAESRRSLHAGYGVHVGFLGHDLHGLRMGPDGKLYFSIGDRGLRIETANRTLDYTDSGTVLRCNPDGSDLEVFAFGLRNPQELAFDQYGNLFTGDNNSDGGDQARFVHVVEGGDSGWRIGYQFITKPVPRGPWNAEKLWHPQWDGQAAYLLPPIANVANGPSGLCYYPGTGLPPRYRDHFFLCDFRGSAVNSGVHALAVKPKGASFEMADQHEFIWSMLATDCDFGPDGGFYISDWVEGWDAPGKGRIHRVIDPALAADAKVLEVKRLLAEGNAKRSIEDLTKLLAHEDMRIRQEAQFALVARALADAAKKSEVAVVALAHTALTSKHQLARLHAIWGLGQIGRELPPALGLVTPLVNDADAEVRAQVAKVLGEGRFAAAFDKLLSRLSDDNPRVRFCAAIALGKLGRGEAIAPLVQLLRDNADADPYLRHAAVMGLVGISTSTGRDLAKLLAAADDSSPAVRRGVLLVLRRLASPHVARFLADADPQIVAEAARAINDAPIAAAMPQLAAMAARSGLLEPAQRRALNANFRLGQRENAAALANFAARAEAPEALRVEALAMLADWEKPSGRDQIVGLWRPIEPRSANDAAAALAPVLAGVFSGPDKVRQSAAETAGKLGIKEVGPTLVALAIDRERSPAARVQAIAALQQLNDARLADVTETALADGEPLVRAAGQRALATREPKRALQVLADVLDRGSLAEKQAAFATLAGMNRADADALLEQWLDKLLDHTAPAEIAFDLLSAAATRPGASILGKLATYQSRRAADDRLAEYRETLVGGDAQRGHDVFFDKAEVSCLRCHKVRGQGGDVGPDLSRIAMEKNREYLLESLVDPNRQIAKGFETVVISKNSGITHVGVLKGEDEREVRLITAEGKTLVVDKREIDERAHGQSAMPDSTAKRLTKAELRDLVEFLSTLK